MLTLIHYPLCPFSRSIRLSLAELGLQVDFMEERPWEWRPEFLEINPAGNLPVLVLDDEVPLCGAYAISEYLAETATESFGSGRRFTLLPEKAQSRAEVRRLVDWFHNKFYNEVGNYLIEEKVYGRFQSSSLGPDMALVRAGQENLRYHMRYIGYLAERRNWLGGSDLSYADLAAAAHLSVIDYLGDVPWADYPAAKTWYSRIKSRPSFRPLLQDRVPGVLSSSHYADLDF